VSARTRGIVLAAIQLLIVLSLGAKLLYDRMTRPRAWALVNTYDPDLPVRGRYLWEQLRMPSRGFTFSSPKNIPNANWNYTPQWAYYTAENGQLIANFTGAAGQPGGWVSLWKQSDGSVVAQAQQSVFLFIPDTANVPTLARGDEFWMEVTLPKKGPPRPIRMAIKKGGVFTPLDFN
jgi:hypothetical protein